MGNGSIEKREMLRENVRNSNGIYNNGMLIYMIYYVAYSSIYIARMNFSVVSALFESAGTLNKGQIGLIGSIFSLTYAAAKLPGGYIGDRKPAQKVIVFGLLLAAFSNLFIGFVPVFYSIAIMWGLNAVGQSMLWGPTLRNVNQCFEPAKAKVMCQLLSTSVAVGSILGLLIAGGCSSLWGAAACFMIPGTITLVMALVVRFVIPGWNQKADEKEKKTGRSISLFLRDKAFHQMIVPALSHGMIKDNINVWLAVYFVDTFGIDLSAIAFYVFVIPLFGLVGRMIYPALYKVMKNDSRISVCSFVLAIILLLVLCMPFVTPLLALFCLGMVSALVSVINVHMLSMFPSRYAKYGNVAFCASLMDVITYGGAGLGSLFFGLLIQQYGFNSMFLVWGLVSMLSIVFLLSDCKNETAA